MSFEILVRPAAAVPVLRQPSPDVAVTTEDDEALIEWGRGPLGTVQRSTSYQTLPSTDTGFNWEDLFPDVPQPGDEQTPEFVFDEVSRKTHVVRITDPLNSANHVDVEVIDAIAFQSTLGVYVFRFNNPK